MGPEELALLAMAVGDSAFGDARIGEASETSHCSLACASGCGPVRSTGFPECAETSQQTFWVAESSIEGPEGRSHKTLAGAHGD